MLSNIFFLPVMDRILLYAPLHGVTALINKAAAVKIQELVLQSDAGNQEAESALIELLKQTPTAPRPIQGKIRNPLFLGLIPTRGCNMYCRYCDFPVSKDLSKEVMSIDTCRRAIDAYFALLEDNHHRHANIHFFGGEPFYAPQVVFFAVEYANYLAAKKNMTLHTEASSNGLIEGKFLEWTADRFNSIVLSFDGLEETQNYLRPAKNMRPSYAQVAHTAKRLSKSLCELVIRRCVPNASLDTLLETSVEMVRQFQPSILCLEPLTTSQRSIKFGIQSPDPWEFARQFLACYETLQGQGVEVVLSTADLNQQTVSSCPVGNDALIVSPDGRVDACYQPEKTWLAQGMDLNSGKLVDSTFQIDQARVDHIRNTYQVDNKTQCADCFCRFHCAGACHINHNGDQPAGAYDSLCIQTRLVTIGKLLMKIQQEKLFHAWLADKDAQEESCQVQSDRIEDWR